MSEIMLNVSQVDPVSGRIIIDGIDISTIGIHDLRSRLVGRFHPRSFINTDALFLDIHTTGQYLNILFLADLTGE